MSKRETIILRYQVQKYNLIGDDGKTLTFKKKFSIGIFLLWFFLTGIGAIGYAVYHFAKPKVYETYKK